MKDVFQIFCESFPWPITIDWFGKVGYTETVKGRRIKLELDDRQVCEHYTGFYCTVIDDRLGIIDQTLLRFNSFLDPRHRTDDRPDYKGGPQLFYAWYHNSELGWYIAKPSDLKPYTHAVTRWTQHFGIWN